MLIVLDVASWYRAAVEGLLAEAEINRYVDYTLVLRGIEVEQRVVSVEE
ncbi:hypothetical protein EYZ11_005090 [Aspergillus tanneri]|uniref:Uncharacterized protein n=1 Tax=Aspergillus tanneri TaxID=1220188 RepID=A0A4S3JLA4_9EURO|nr:hypothetical protein EYZ11_005090 [Aspergillus tanneri]